MEDFSIYRYMHLGIVHFKAFPQVVNGDGPVIETMRKIVEDDFWTAIEVGWIKDVKKRNEARKLLDVAHMEVCYATQPRVLGQKLNPNSFDKVERNKAITNMKSGIEEAYQLGASCVRVLSGKDPGDEKREDAKKIFTDTLRELCEYTRELGDIQLYLKIFDRDIDKKSLIGHFQDAADVAEKVYKDFKNFGILSDLSHFPLHFHIGNCVMRDRKHFLYGDLQPRFGIPEGELDTPDVRDYFKLLLELKLLNPENKPVMSVEVRPLLAEEYSEIIIANAKRVIKEAWATL